MIFTCNTLILCQLLWQSSGVWSGTFSWKLSIPKEQIIGRPWTVSSYVALRQEWCHVEIYLRCFLVQLAINDYSHILPHASLISLKDTLKSNVETIVQDQKDEPGRSLQVCAWVVTCGARVALACSSFVNEVPTVMFNLVSSSLTLIWSLNRGLVCWGACTTPHKCISCREDQWGR